MHLVASYRFVLQLIASYCVLLRLIASYCVLLRLLQQTWPRVMCGFAGMSRGARPHSGTAAAHAAATASTRASDGPSGTSLPRRPSNPKVWKHRRHAAGWCLQNPSAARLPGVRPAVRVRVGALVCGCARALARARFPRARACA